MFMYFGIHQCMCQRKCLNWKKTGKYMGLCKWKWIDNSVIIGYFQTLNSACDKSIKLVTVVPTFQLSHRLKQLDMCRLKIQNVKRSMTLTFEVSIQVIYTSHRLLMFDLSGKQLPIMTVHKEGLNWTSKTRQNRMHCTAITKTIKCLCRSNTNAEI